MGKISGDPFLLGKKAGRPAEETREAEPKKKDGRHEHSFRDPKMPSIVGPGRDRGGGRQDGD
jgi:hypothetical protein